MTNALNVCSLNCSCHLILSFLFWLILQQKKKQLDYYNFLSFKEFYPSQSEAFIRRYSLKRVFLKFCIIHRKTPLLESLFNKVKVLQHTKRALGNRSFFCEFWKILMTPLYRTPTCNCF